jgi:hypothetical protein
MIIPSALFCLAECIAVSSFFGKHRLPLDLATGFLPVLVAVPFAAALLHFRIVRKLAPEVSSYQTAWKSIESCQATLIIALYAPLIFILTTLLDKVGIR